MHYFMISICKTVPQYSEEKGYEIIRKIKFFDFENTRSDVKKWCDH